MSVANKLYDRSHGFVGDVSASNPPMLYVDGALPDVPKGDAYEGRLQIHNNVGPCKVSLISGSLPNGYKLRVDNTTFQVVISWPSYGVDVVGIDNAGFGNGNDGSWDLGPGWSITNTGPTDPNDPLNTNEAKYADSYGLADITNNRYVAVTAGQSITANCDMNLGGSRSDGRILLKWYDTNRNYVGSSLGEELSDNGAWQRPSVVGNAPQDGFVRISAHVNREHDNKPCWVDNFTWNYIQGSQGTNSPIVIPLSIQVTDSLNRTAVWSGTIHVVDAIVEALHYFNTSLLIDDTGNTWQYYGSGGVGTQAIATDRWGAQPATVPYMTSAKPIVGDFAQTLEGTASLSTCPESKNHDGTYDYVGWVNAGVVFTFGTKAPGTTDDFCIEMYFRRNALALQGNTGLGFTLLAGMGFAARMTTDTQMTMESGQWIGQTNQSVNPLTIIYNNNLNTKPLIGPWLHHAITRNGDIITAYVNGVKYLQWSGGSNWNIGNISTLLIGNVKGSSGSYLGFGGQYDGVRYTRNWSRYNGNFTPPTLPY